MNPKRAYYRNLSTSIIKKMKNRNFEGYYCETTDEALNLALSLIPEGASITHGGSKSIEEIGLLHAVKTGNYDYFDRNATNTKQEFREAIARGVLAHTFLTSTNAITLNGELINVDGISNRVALLAFGPEQVLVIVGMNKVVADTDAGIYRSQNVAAPPNALRLDCNTPCHDLGYCTQCQSDDSMCVNILITRRSRIPGRVKIILVGQELGF